MPQHEILKWGPPPERTPNAPRQGGSRLSFATPVGYPREEATLQAYVYGLST